MMHSMLGGPIAPPTVAADYTADHINDCACYVCDLPRVAVARQRMVAGLAAGEHYTASTIDWIVSMVQGGGAPGLTDAERTEWARHHPGEVIDVYGVTAVRS